MSPNQVNFENLHFDPFYDERFSHTEEVRDPNERLFNEVNTESFEYSYCFFSNEIENLLSQTKTLQLLINGIHENIRSLSKSFDNLLDILRDSKYSFNVFA